MSKSLVHASFRREVLSAGSATPGSRGRPENARPSLLGALRGLTGALRDLLRAGFELLMEWQERSRQRHMLMSLDDRMLRDIGLTRPEAEAEYRKPPWGL